MGDYKRALETDRDYQRLLETISKGGGTGGLGGYSPPHLLLLKNMLAGKT